MSGGGTIDLDWSTLTPEFAGRIVELLNSALVNATRPSFIGPVSVSSFEFGTNAPEVEIIDIRDIYPDFLEDEGEDEDDDIDETEDLHAAAAERERMMEEYDWVSRREGLPSEIYDDHGSNFSSPPFGIPPSHLAGATGSRRGGAHEDSWRYANGLPGLPNASPLGHPIPTPAIMDPTSNSHTSSSSLDSPQSSRSSSPPLPSKPSDTENGHPDLQLHFRLFFESNLRLMISTSLQINYPSPMIMALPIKLSLTGLVLDGELVVAYEGSRKRIHMCFLDDQAAHQGGPVPASQSRYGDEEDEADANALVDDRTPAMRASATISRLGAKPSQAAPAGVRLLPSIVLESEIGQEDKHVLRNVARVERFIQDVIRKTIEDELVFPNFQTIVLPNSSTPEE